MCVSVRRDEIVKVRADLCIRDALFHSLVIHALPQFSEASISDPAAAQAR